MSGKVEWSAVLLRATGFVGTSNNTPEPGAQWQSLTGEAPENVQSNPRAGHATESGAWNGGVLEVQGAPGRFDVRWRHRELLPEDEFPPNLGMFEHACEEFETLVADLLERRGPYQRLAFGTELVKSAESQKAAYEILNEQIPCIALDSNARDFFFSINRRRPSAIVPATKVNRISKWRAIRHVEHSVVLGGGSISGAQTNFGRHYFAALELDINTVPDDGLELSCDITKPLFNELIQLAIQIADCGDVA